jgi:hypothetical protein
MNQVVPDHSVIELQSPVVTNSPATFTSSLGFGHVGGLRLRDQSER